jgi:uncharacterized protein (DUF885 family)
MIAPDPGRRHLLHRPDRRLLASGPDVVERPAGVTTFNTWRELTTVYHEGVPGITCRSGRPSTTPPSSTGGARQICWLSGHGEGWALYAERLMDEFGFLTDAGDRFGMLDSQRLRATRVVLDLGVHLGKPAFEQYGGGVWDYDKAWAAAAGQRQHGRGFLRFELNRYMGWPGQAPSYKVGQRLWEQIRAEASAAAPPRRGVLAARLPLPRPEAGLGPLDVLRDALLG